MCLRIAPVSVGKDVLKGRPEGGEGKGQALALSALCRIATWLASAHPKNRREAIAEKRQSNSGINFWSPN